MPSTILDQSRLAIAAAPAVFRPLVVRANGINTTTTVMGTTAAGLGIRNIHAARGALFTEDADRERRRVALIGPTVARILFDTSDPVGEVAKSAPFRSRSLASSAHWEWIRRGRSGRSRRHSV